MDLELGEGNFNLCATRFLVVAAVVMVVVFLAGVGGAVLQSVVGEKGERANTVNTFFFIYGYYIRMRRQIGNGWARWGS